MSLRDTAARIIADKIDVTESQYEECCALSAEAIIEALREAGYAIVPREATYQMLDRLAYHLGCKVLEEAQMVSAYRAMIAVGEVK